MIVPEIHSIAGAGTHLTIIEAGTISIHNYEAIHIHTKRLFVDGLRMDRNLAVSHSRFFGIQEFLSTSASFPRSRMFAFDICQNRHLKSNDKSQILGMVNLISFFHYQIFITQTRRAAG